MGGIGYGADTMFLLVLGKRVDSIVIVTKDGKKFKAGGDGGEEHTQDVGDGVLVGFDGASGLDVDRVGLIFLKKDGGK